MIQFRF